MNTFSDIFGSAFGEEASAMIQDINKKDFRLFRRESRW